MKKTEVEVPMLKRKVLDEFLGLPIEAETKQELLTLKHEFGVDHLEWVRRLIRANLPALVEKYQREA